MINTRFWSDTFIVDKLNPLDRYLFLYLLTNEKTNSIWIYEISLRTISFETWIESDTLKNMLKRLEDKVLYIDGWICFKKFVRHQSPNPNQQKWMHRVWEEEVSAIIKEKLKPFAKGFEGFIKDSLLNLTKLNLTKPNLKGSKISKEISHKKNKTDFKELCKSIDLNFFIDKYEMTELDFKEEANYFYMYWTEKSVNWKKERWEKEKTFDIVRRFDNWLRNNKKWNTRKRTNKEILDIPEENIF